MSFNQYNFKYVNKKALITCFLLILSVEIVLRVMEFNNMFDEPYLWESRNEIPFKLNDCKKIFNDPENKDKIKIVVVGDSYLEGAFDPITFDNLTNEKTISYNFGIKGTAVPTQALLIKELIIKKLNPDIIIWTLSIVGDFKENEKVERQEFYNLDSAIARSYSNNLAWCTIDTFFKWCLIKTFSIYKYRQFLFPKLFNLNDNLTKELNQYKDEYIRGFRILNDTYPGKNQNVTESTTTSNLAEGRKDLFLEIIDEFKRNKIDFLVISKSNHFDELRFPPVDDLFNSLDKKNFLDLNGNVNLSYNENCHNYNHINYKGAQIFTKYVAEKLKNESFL
ncbi:MAG: hypothetical protein ACTSR8_00200 [Promethearchaeota archaeon]